MKPRTRVALFTLMAWQTPQIACAAGGVKVFGSLFFDGAALNSDLNGNGTTTVTSERRVSTTIDAGYAFDNGIYLGAKYVDHNETDKTSLLNATAITSPSQTVTSDFAAPGVSLGYVFDGGLFVIASGLFVPDVTVETTSISGTTTAYSKSEAKGSYGYAVDLGYAYHITPAFGLGPQVSYYAANFSTYSAVSSGATTSGSLHDYKMSRLLPYIVLAFSF